MQDRKKAAATVNAEGIVTAMQAMNCQAAGISSYDLAGGIGLLEELQEQGRVTWLSGNLVDSKKKEPVFTPSLFTEVNGIKIAILGITGEQAGEATGIKEAGYTILPWQETLPKMAAAAGKKADMTILLSSYPYLVNKEIAESVAGVHLILASGHAVSSSHPYQAENTVIAQTGARGKYLGMMRINWTETQQWSENFSSQIQQARKQLKQVNSQLARLEKQGDKDKLKKNKRYQNMLAKKKQISKQIKKLQEDKAAAPESETLCSFSNKFIPLETSLPEDPQVKKIIDQTIQQVNMVNQKHAPVATKQPTATLQDLAGWQACQKCHQKQVEFWQGTKHAAAWSTLEKKNQQFNEECLICHVTLPYYDDARVKSENLLLMLPGTLKNVGCETCHGPAADHSTKQMPIPVPHPDEKVCAGCHTTEHDDNFVFADKMKKIRCPEK